MDKPFGENQGAVAIVQDLLCNTHGVSEGIQEIWHHIALERQTYCCMLWPGKLCKETCATTHGGRLHAPSKDLGPLALA